MLLLLLLLHCMRLYMISRCNVPYTRKLCVCVLGKICRSANGKRGRARRNSVVFVFVSAELQR